MVVSTVAKRPCATCDVSFDTLEQHREHAKSPEHIFNLRNRFLLDDETDPSHPRECFQGDERFEKEEELEDGDEIVMKEEELEDDEEDTPDFDPEACLFCHHLSSSFDENLSHMNACHSFSIPYAQHLIVEPEVLIWYLHYTIFGSFECMCCGKQRHSLEAIQHHMQAKGHSHFQMTPEMMEFYDAETMMRLDAYETSRAKKRFILLESGTLLARRKKSPLSKRVQVRKEMHMKKRAALPKGTFANAPTIRDTDTPHPLDFALMMQKALIATRDRGLLAAGPKYHGIKGRMRWQRHRATYEVHYNRHHFGPVLRSGSLKLYEKMKKWMRQDYYHAQFFQNVNGMKRRG
ncbi:hypothetical protein ACHAPU_002183 [Fusarium lateritium]